MKGEVVTLVTVMGEIVGRCKESDYETITLTDPRLFVQQEGGAGYAPGVCMTGAGNPAELVFRQNQILTVVPTHDDLVKGWSAATSGIVL
tara:strand:+ start:3257 stop:3526 length:270 start_codon:yes stop_codon:yes gene_type:complete